MPKHFYHPLVVGCSLAHKPLLINDIRWVMVHSKSQSKSHIQEISPARLDVIITVIYVQVLNLLISLVIVGTKR